MKRNSILLIVLFICLAGKGLSQANVYFQNNPVWHIEDDWNSGSDCSGENHSYNYYVNGDTVLYSQAYKKVFRNDITTYISGGCYPTGQDTSIGTSPVFYLRSLARQMFVLFPADTLEKLLYDFNLAVGDTLPMTYSYNGYPVYTVAAIDSFSTPNGYLQKFSLNVSGGPAMHDTLYEGIGSTGGLTEQIFQLYLSGGHKLLCYALNGNSYVYSSGSSCDVLSGIEEFTSENTVTVYPNPFNDQATFRFKTELKNAMLSLYSTTGALVKSQVFSGSAVVLTKEQLAEGIYYYRVTTGLQSIAAGKISVRY